MQNETSMGIRRAFPILIVFEKKAAKKT